MMTIDTKKVAMALRIGRAKKDLSQKQLADLSGVSETTIVFLESGKHSEVRANTLARIAKALEIDLEDLI